LTASYDDSLTRAGYVLLRMEDGLWLADKRLGRYGAKGWFLGLASRVIRQWVESQCVSCRWGAQLL